MDSLTSAAPAAQEKSRIIEGQIAKAAVEYFRHLALSAVEVRR